MNETLKWTLWILGGLVASLVSGLIFTWMCMGYKTEPTPRHIRILSFPFLIGGIPFFIVAWCVIMIVQHFAGTNVKREEEPVKKTGKRINCDTTDAGLYKELGQAVDQAYGKLMKGKKTEFKGIDGKTIINCEDLARVRPFKVMVEIPSKNGPTVVGIKCCVRLCDNSVTTEQLYRELDKAIEVAEETYNEIIKLKRTWCAQMVTDGKISPFAVTPGMVPSPKEENE